MVIMQKPGSEHTYEYKEFPAVRYHASGETRTIHSEAEEEKGWYNNPAKALKVRQKQLKAEADANAREKEKARRLKEKEAAKAKEEASTAQHPHTTAEIFRMKKEEALKLARGHYHLDVAGDIKIQELKKLLREQINGK